MCESHDESGIWRYAYDAFGNLVQEDRIDLGVTCFTDTCFTCVISRAAAWPLRMPGVNLLARARGIIVQLTAITMVPCKALNSTAKALLSGSTSLDFIAP
ncbi:MAG: hypothetical protein GY875_02530 [Gammaproteobacteria bacterium]|nr:hypothetical protein [Gammaproteobacteria bacterium]